VSQNEPAPSVEPIDTPTRSRNRVVAAFLLVAVFIAGALAGVVVDRVVLFRTGGLLPHGGLRVASPRIVHALTRELKLDAGQQKQITDILERHRQSIERIWSAMRPQVRRELESTNEEIERVLRPDQRPRFEQLRKIWQTRAQRLFAP
jgi:hypothetical protein